MEVTCAISEQKLQGPPFSPAVLPVGPAGPELRTQPLRGLHLLTAASLVESQLPLGLSAPVLPDQARPCTLTYFDHLPTSCGPNTVTLGNSASTYESRGQSSGHSGYACDFLCAADADFSRAPMERAPLLLMFSTRSLDLRPPCPLGHDWHGCLPTSGQSLQGARCPQAKPGPPCLPLWAGRGQLRGPYIGRARAG